MLALDHIYIHTQQRRSHSNDHCFTGGTREIVWYDTRKTSAAAGSYTVDTGSGTLLPLFDADTGMMVMPSKGDGSIR